MTMAVIIAMTVGMTTTIRPDPIRADPIQSDTTQDLIRPDPIRFNPRSDPIRSNPTRSDPTRSNPRSDSIRSDPTRSYPRSDSIRFDPSPLFPSSSATLSAYVRAIRSSFHFHGLSCQSSWSCMRMPWASMALALPCETITFHGLSRQCRGLS